MNAAVRNVPFHLGKPLLLMATISLLSSGFVLRHRPSPAADFNVWVFALPHANILRSPDNTGRPSLAQQYHDLTGSVVNVSLIASRALDTRLVSLFMSNDPDHQAPDLAEIEIGSLGKFFRALQTRSASCPSIAISNDPAGSIASVDYALPPSANKASSSASPTTFIPSPSPTAATFSSRPA